jgi:hypothetical protein
MVSSQALIEAVVRERRESRWRPFRCTECGAVLGPATRTGTDATLVRRCPICRTAHPAKDGALR